MTRKSLAVLLSIVAFAASAFAQTESEIPGWTATDPPRWNSRTAPPPPLYQDETPEERMKRVGVSEDPGTDPDPNRVWARNGARWVITKFLRYGAVYYGQPKGMVRALGAVNFASEIYLENEEFVWVWLDAPTAPAIEPPAPAEPAEPAAPAVEETGEQQSPRYEDREEFVTLTTEDREYLAQLKKEFEVRPVAASGTTLRFEESSAGLPARGSWRNGLDVADMNADGLLDLVIPPQRGGAGFPVIFLGTTDGQWKYWNAQWPLGYNYGTVVAGDLNGDGHLDVAVGAHLASVKVALGDGTGTFRDASKGLPERFATRRILLEDVDGDGDLDILALSEGATMGDGIERESRLRLFVNDGTGANWTQVDIAEIDRQVAGDWMTAGDFNGDGRVDVAGSSIFFSGPDLVYLQRRGGGWAPWGRGSLPFRSFYSALASGDFTPAKGEDLILTYRRSWPGGRIRPKDFEGPGAADVVGIERVTWDRRGRPQRSTIVSWEGTNPIWGIAGGDFNRDGHRDLVYSRSGPRRLEFLLGDGKGGFRSAEAVGIDLPDLTTYDVQVADVNADGHDDVLMMFEKSGRASDGSVRVWLGRGAETARK